MKYYINLEYKKTYYKLFILGYTSDGGFFVKDLINDGGEYLIIKMLIPPPKIRKFGEYKIRMEKCQHWITVNSPKITHHINGITHISGQGIMSGFYKFFSGHKGVVSQSMDLEERNNDGGPIFIFHVKNLPLTKEKNKDNIYIKLTDQIIDFYRKPTCENDYSFALEFFYLPKAAITKYLNVATGMITFSHPNYGIVPLKYIPPPHNAPGALCIFTRVMSKGDGGNQFAFSLNGGAGTILNKGDFEHLSIVYPYKDDLVSRKNIKNLDFKGINKIKVYIDQILYNIKNAFISFLFR